MRKTYGPAFVIALVIASILGSEWFWPLFPLLLLVTTPDKLSFGDEE